MIAPTAVLQHRGQEGAGEADRSQQVDGDGLVELGGGHGGEGFHAEEGGVVDQCVDPAETAEDHRRELVQALRVAQVDGVGGDFAALGGDGRGDAVEFVCFKSGRDHRAPCWAMQRAMPSPKPRPAPVTTTVWPRDV